MAAGPADGGTGIGHGVERSGAVLAGGAVFDRHGHHAALGKMEAMRGKLADQTAIPRATEEKKNGWEGGGGGVNFGFKDPGGEFVAGDLLVDIAGGLGQQRAVAVQCFHGSPASREGVFHRHGE